MLPNNFSLQLIFLFSFSLFTGICFLYSFTKQGIPQAVLPPLPKRPALEKTNGATAVFNTGIFQYQQALANMQLQQHTAFLPPGKGSELIHERIWGAADRYAGRADKPGPQFAVSHR